MSSSFQGRQRTMAQLSNHPPHYQPSIQGIPDIPDLARLPPVSSFFFKGSTRVYKNACSFIHSCAHLFMHRWVPTGFQPWVGHWEHFQERTASLTSQGLDSSRRDGQEVSVLRVKCQSGSLHAERGGHQF